MRNIKYLIVITCLSCGLAGAADGDLAARQAVAQQAFLQGDFETAADHWTMLAEAYRAAGDTEAQSRALAHAAESDQALGLHALAIEQLERAQALMQGATPDAWQATLQGALGAAYTVTRSWDEAEQSLDAGLMLARRVNAPAVEAAILNDFGNLRNARGQYGAALDSYEACLRIAKRSDNHALAARAAVNAGAMAIETAQFPQAEAYLATAVSETGQLADSHDKAYLLIRVARLQTRLAEQLPDRQAELLPAAYEQFTRAAAVAEALGDQRALSYARGYLGGLYETRQRHEEALRLTNQAIYAIQSLYAPEIRYRWEWQTGRILKAQGNRTQAIDAYRRAVASLQAIRAELDTGSDTVAASFRRDAGTVYLELADLLLAAADDTPASERGQVQHYLVEARDTVEQLKTTELQDYFQDDCVAAVRARIKEIDETISGGTAVLYPIALADRIELLLSLPSGLMRVSVPVGREQLDGEVHEFRRLLVKRTTRQYLRPARQLYDWLIRPLEQELEDNRIRILVLVPDAALRTVPLAALHDGKEFLVRRYAIATTPSMRLTDPRPIERQHANLLLNGLTVPVEGFPPLLYVQSELESIQALYGGKRLQNEEFRKQRLQEELAGNEYSIVHFATHGLFSGQVKDSFILTYDGRLSMDDLERFVGVSWFRQDVPVELLTLSACETAVGDDTAALGLAGVAIKAGARSALASLWSINDKASSELVANFYRELKDPSVTKAEALQAAQVQFLDDLRYRHPVYWSPFLLIGNWL